MAACSAQAPHADPGAASVLDPACVALVAAAPADWAERMPPVLARGPAAGPDLVAALRDGPDGLGVQAAIAVLGRLGHPAARPFLEEQVDQHAPQAAEAALALGRLPAPESIPLLRRVAGDRLADVTLRAACAAALIELGAGAEVLPLVRALVLAGSPAGRGPASEVGLPDQPRWALPRYLVLRALRRAAPGEDFALDTDSPWPDLQRAADAITTWLESR